MSRKMLNIFVEAQFFPVLSVSSKESSKNPSCAIETELGLVKIQINFSKRCAKINLSVGNYLFKRGLITWRALARLEALSCSRSRGNGQPSYTDYGNAITM